jgi:hypothetical protein
VLFVHTNIKKKIQSTKNKFIFFSVDRDINDRTNIPYPCVLQFSVRSLFSDDQGDDHNSRPLIGSSHYSGTPVKKIPSFEGTLILKVKRDYPSTTLYLVPNKLIFRMLSMVKDCGFTLLSWGCLELSDFLTSKD